jgi:hypothetical protein
MKFLFEVDKWIKLLMMGACISGSVVVVVNHFHLIGK